MAAHTFSEILLHANWHTDHDLPCLHGTVETFVHNFLRNSCQQTKGVYFQGVGGTNTHVHLVIQVEPSVLVSEFLGELKGACSHEANVQFGRKVLTWQRGYGVVSFSRKHLGWVLEYVAHQREHHSEGKTVPKLELTELADLAQAGSVAEEEEPYTVA